MSEITYNGVTLQDVLTQSVNQEPIYDQPGGVDQIYVKTTVTVQFTFHTVTGANLGYDTGTNLASGTESVLRLLNTNRRRFTMTIGGVTLFDVVPSATEPNVTISGNTQDIDNGPRPSCKIDEINGIGIARGTFTVVLAVPSCGTPTDIVNLRWWTGDDVDSNWYTTRTITGRLRVANKDIGPHAMRGLIFPPLQKGFRRDKMTFTEDPNGLALDFTITDLEVYRSAPGPASTWRGNHRISSQVPGATVVESEASVELNGAHDVHQTDLILLGVKIIDTKLQLQQQGIGGGGDSAEKARAMVMFYAIDAAMGENRVQLICRIKHYGKDTEGFNLFNQVGPQFGQPLPPDISADGTSYDPLVSRLLPGATAPLTTIMVNKLQTPCSPATMENAFDTRVERNPSATKGDGEPPEVEADIKPIPPEEDPVGATAEHKEAPYLNYRTTTIIAKKSNGAVMSIADDTSTSAVDAAFVRFGASVTKRYVYVTATRLSKKPEMPDPLNEFQDSKGKVYFLLDSVVGEPEISKDANGSQEFTVQMTLIYLVNNGYDLNTEGFTQITVPWLENQAQDSETLPGIFSIKPVPD